MKTAAGAGLQRVFSYPAQEGVANLVHHAEPATILHVNHKSLPRALLSSPAGILERGSPGNLRRLEQRVADRGSLRQRKSWDRRSVFASDWAADCWESTERLPEILQLF